MNLLAIEIGGTKTQLFAGNDAGEILERMRFDVRREAGAEGIREDLASGLPEMMARWQPSALGVGYGGPVDWRSGKIAKSHHIAGWDGFPFGEWLAQRTGIPVFVENDANVAALGEALRGAGRGRDPVLWVNLGSGVGGGLVGNGRIYHGAPPGEVEIGHLRLERDGTIVEDRCAGWGLDKIIRAEIAKSPESVLARLVGSQAPGGEAKHLTRALQEHCGLAHRILATATREMAFALSHAVHLLHPEIIVIGGGVSLIGEPLRAAIAENLPGFLMDAFRPGPRVALAELREDAVPVGALMLAAQRLKA
jgi:glucokinase